MAAAPFAIKKIFEKRKMIVKRYLSSYNILKNAAEVFYERNDFTCR